jgi:hypothetical protein
MRGLHGLAMAGLLAIASGLLAAPEKPKTMADVLARSTPSDWRALDPENTLYLELATGRVVIELARAFAPRHTANIKALVREHYFDALAIVRVQDNYVVQWADPESTREIRNAKRTLPAEFTSMQVAADVPESQRSALEVIRTDTRTFDALVEARRNRRDDWYKIPAGYIELCNVPIVVRPRPAP